MPERHLALLRGINVGRAQATTRALGERVTMRNWATVGKLQVMLRGA